MNEPKNNINGDDIKGFLKKLEGNSPEELDDFEKEALEGFAMLKSEEEAVELKANVDKRIFSEVIVKSEKSNMKFWYAAAGLAFFIGLSVFLVLDKNLSFEKDELALNTTNEVSNQNTELNLLDSIQKSGVTAEPKKEMIENLNTISANQSGSFKNFSKAPSNPTTAKPDKEEESLAFGAKQEAGAPVRANSLTGNTEADAAQAIKKSEQLAPEMASTENEKNVKALEDIDAKTIEVEAKENKKAKSRRDESAQQPSQESMAPLREVAASADIVDIGFAVYKGGNKAFQNDLKLALKDFGLNKSFEAIVSINENAKAENVIFINKNNLTKNETEEIIKVLKAMGKFQVSGKTPESGFFQYPFSFKP